MPRYANGRAILSGLILVGGVALITPSASYGQLVPRVLVANPASNPVNVKPPTRIPWQTQLVLDLAEGETSKTVPCPLPRRVDASPSNSEPPSSWC